MAGPGLSHILSAQVKGLNAVAVDHCRRRKPDIGKRGLAIPGIGLKCVKRDSGRLGPGTIPISRLVERRDITGNRSFLWSLHPGGMQDRGFAWHFPVDIDNLTSRRDAAHTLEPVFVGVASLNQPANCCSPFRDIDIQKRSQLLSMSIRD